MDVLTRETPKPLLPFGGSYSLIDFRSVLGPGVRVEAGAVVTDCVVHADVAIAADATLDWAVLAESSSIGTGARVGALADEQPATGLVLVGRESVVADGAMIEPGARLEPGTSA